VKAPLNAAVASAGRLRLVRQPETGQRHAAEADAEFHQRRPARERSGQALGEFVELMIHNYPYVLVERVLSDFQLLATSCSENQGRTIRREAETFE